MKKGIGLGVLFFLASVGSNASSVVLLSGGGNIPASTSVNIPLTGLAAGITYSVVCYIDTTFAFQYVKLSANLSDTTSVVTSYSLNGNIVSQAPLIPGHNIAVINGTFNSPSTSSIVITNLDQLNLFNVNNCFGVPITQVSPA